MLTVFLTQALMQSSGTILEQAPARLEPAMSWPGRPHTHRLERLLELMERFPGGIRTLMEASVPVNRSSMIQMLTLSMMVSNHTAGTSETAHQLPQELP